VARHLDALAYRFRAVRMLASPLARARTAHSTACLRGACCNAELVKPELNTGQLGAVHFSTSWLSWLGLHSPYPDNALPATLLCVQTLLYLISPNTTNNTVSTQLLAIAAT
jgi:hypothetical protein